MPGAHWSGSIKGMLTALAVAGLGTAAFAAELVSTIDTPGQGRLIRCRDWLVYTSCWSYRHIAIPARINIGDNIELAFGSNNKSINFPVKRILHEGDRCDVYNTADGAVRKVNRIKIEGCRPVTEGVP